MLMLWSLGLGKCWKSLDVKTLRGAKLNIIFSVVLGLGDFFQAEIPSLEERRQQFFDRLWVSSCFLKKKKRLLWWLRSCVFRISG